MGKTNRGERRPSRETSGELTSRPMAGAFKGMKIGPLCLACHGPIDTREQYSLSNPRGSRKNQRQGFLHEDCEEAQAKKFYEEKYEQAIGLKGQVVYLKYVKTNNSLLVPVMSEEDVENFMQTINQDGEV